MTLRRFIRWSLWRELLTTRDWRRLSPVSLARQAATTISNLLTARCCIPRSYGARQQFQPDITYSAAGSLTRISVIEVINHLYLFLTSRLPIRI
jgi:hypothetical protein